MSNGYKMFIIRGLYIKSRSTMPFKEFLKSDLLKELVTERKNGVDRFEKEEEIDNGSEKE